MKEPNRSPQRGRLFRINIVDERGVTSFLGPAHGPKVMTAAAAHSPATAHDMLALAKVNDKSWITRVMSELARFDEHNVDEIDARFREEIESQNDHDHRAFRVLDRPSRQRSLVPGKLGLVMFNLRDQRIVQVENYSDDVRRKDRGRIRIDGKASGLLFHYELPESWTVVP